MSAAPQEPNASLPAPGGVIQTYLGYDPVRFPPPTSPASGADIAGAAVEHLLAFGGGRPLTAEELAEAIELDPEMIRGLGPSIESLIRRLEARRDALLRTYELDSARRTADHAVDEAAEAIEPPDALREAFEREVRQRQLRGMERLWYRAERTDPGFAARLPGLMEAVAMLFEIDRTLARWTFTGRTGVTPEEAIRIGEELETIERLLEQLREAQRTAKLAVIDMQALEAMLGASEMADLRELAEQVRRLIEEAARAQGLEEGPEGYRVTPQAMRRYQSSVLAEIFHDLESSRSGRHEARPEGEGAVETARTRPYEFGDPASDIEATESILEAFIRQGEGGTPGRPPQVTMRDLVVRRTINRPRCATALLLDMSGSMRWSGLYVQCKRMALALDGLIRRDYPGDVLRVIEMASFARLCAPGEIAGLMPKPVTIRHPVVRLAADMSDPEISPDDVPPHFTNIQHALQLARRHLAAQDTPNRQVLLITDGLPTAHFEGSRLLLLYPPDRRTEEATLREAMACAREGITINVFLLPTWSQSSEDVRFAHRLAEQTRGRVFFTRGDDIDRFVVWDYVAMRRKIV